MIALMLLIRDNVVTGSCCVLQEAKEIGDEFLALEKYVNLNYLVRWEQFTCHCQILPCHPNRGQMSYFSPLTGFWIPTRFTHYFGTALAGRYGPLPCL